MDTNLLLFVKLALNKFNPSPIETNACYLIQQTYISDLLFSLIAK